MPNQDNQKYFKIITDADFGDTPRPLKDPKMRLAARGIILNDEAKIEENLEDPSIAGPAPELYQLKFIPMRDAEILRYYLEAIKD